MRITYYNERTQLKARVVLEEGNNKGSSIDIYRNWGLHDSNSLDLKAKINWSAVGSRDITHTMEFIAALQKAIEIATEFEQAVYMYDIEVNLGDGNIKLDLIMANSSAMAQVSAETWLQGQGSVTFVHEKHRIK